MTSKCVLAALLLSVACGPGGLDRHAREYVRLAVALGERDPDSIDFYYGPPEWVAELRKHPPRLDEIRKASRVLADQLKKDAVGRALRLAGQANVLADRADALLGVHKSFDEETLEYFGLTVPTPDAGRLSEIRAEIDRLLPGKRSLAERYARFDEKFLVSQDRLPTVMARAMQGCREQTAQHLPLPAGESVKLEYVSEKPWSAFSHYQGNFRSVIEVNAGFALTVDRILQLACHEGYPGHHVQNVFQDIHFVRDLHHTEWLVQPTFSPQSLVSEAIATFAVTLAFPEPERIRFERDALFPLAGIAPNDAERYERIERLVDELQSAVPAIAREFLDGRLEWARAAQALEEQVLMAHPEQTLKYLSEFRSYSITYTYGRDLVAQHIHGWPQFRQLMTDADAPAALRDAAASSMMKP